MGPVSVLHPITYKPLLYFFVACFLAFSIETAGGLREKHIHSIDGSGRSQSRASGGVHVAPEAGVLRAKLSVYTLLLFSG